MPDRYIAHPAGDLQSDPSNRGIFIDDHGRRYLQSGANWYGASRDTGNGSWRVASHDEPGKPGIPVKQRADGTWRVNAEVGLKGGGGSEAEKAYARAAVDSTRRDLDAKTAERDTKLAELAQARVEKDAADRQESVYRRAYEQAGRNFDEASARADHYRSKADEANRRNASSSANNDAFARMVAGAKADMAASNSGFSLPHVRHDQSEVRDAERNHDDWSRQRDAASHERESARYNLGAAMQSQERASRKVSTVENEVFSLESGLLRLRQQLSERERERDRFEAP